MMAFVAITFSSGVQAQVFHGMSIQKACTSPVRTCDSDEDCVDADVCDLDIPDTTSCDIKVTNNDEFGDTLIVNDAFDTIFATAGDEVVTQLPIVAVAGNTTCVVAGALPCFIGPDVGGGVGAVTFRQNVYMPVAADPSPLQSLTTTNVQDACDGALDPGCSQSPADQNYPAQTDLVDGC